MTRAEFEDRVAKILCDPGFVASNEDWADISMVYQFHPAISRTMGKDEIANYYTLGIWRDMIPAAKEAYRLEDDIRKLQNDRERIIKDHEANLRAVNDNLEYAQSKRNEFERKYKRYV
jgi:hypothetical protein